MIKRVYNKRGGVCAFFQSQTLTTTTTTTTINIRHPIVLNQQIRFKTMGEKQGVAPSVFEIPPRDTLFAKMARGEIKPKIIYEDDRALVFEDINPVAPTHLLIISKKLELGLLHLANASDAEELGYLFLVAGKIAKEHNLLEGYRLVINQGLNAQQSINYLHIHLLSGRKFTWPPG
jgi:histidine triad (HIT) family protein